MRKLIFLILITLFAAYAGWAERRPVGHYLSDLRSQVSVVQGQPGERGNLLAVQPELFTPDYQSAERLQLKFHAYLENARRQGLLNERTVVVFPEHVGTWLVASGEKPEVYAAADWPTAMDWMAASNPLKVARGWITARGEQRLTDTLFRMKAVDMAHDYQTLFGGLAHDFKVTVVAGSIVLPDPEVEDGELRPGTGQLYNVSLTFGPDGRPLGQPQRKVFPTRHELSYLNNGRGERLQVLDTPAGRLGVLIGTDSWYPDTYATLVEQRVELLAIPAALNQSGRWQQPWPGFDAELVPGDVRLAPNSLSNAEAWQRLAVGERLLASGARGAAVAFAHSRLWNVTEDGQSLLGSSLHAPRPCRHTAQRRPRPRPADGPPEPSRTDGPGRRQRRPGAQPARRRAGNDPPGTALRAELPGPVEPGGRRRRRLAALLFDQSLQRL